MSAHMCTQHAQVLQESGVPVSNSFHMHVRLNGEFLGLFSFVEMIDRTFLKVCVCGARAPDRAPLCLQP